MRQLLDRWAQRAMTEWAARQVKRWCSVVATRVATSEVEEELARLEEDPRGQPAVDELVEFIADTYVHSGSTPPPQRAERHSPNAVVIGAWRRLPLKQRRLLLLYEARRFTCGEVAQRVKQSETETRFALVDAINRLKEELRAHESWELKTGTW